MHVVVWPVGSCWKPAAAAPPGPSRRRRRRRRCSSRRSDRVTRAAGGRAAVRARVAREQHELAVAVDVHVLVLPERRDGADVSGGPKSTGGSPSSWSRSAVISSSSCGLRRVLERVRLQPEAAGDEHHVELVPALPVLEEVDRRGVLGLGDRLAAARRSSTQRRARRLAPRIRATRRARLTTSLYLSRMPSQNPGTRRRRTVLPWLSRGPQEPVFRALEGVFPCLLARVNRACQWLGSPP